MPAGGWLCARKSRTLPTSATGGSNLLMVQYPFYNAIMIVCIAEIIRSRFDLWTGVFNGNAYITCRKHGQIIEVVPRTDYARIAVCFSQGHRAVLLGCFVVVDFQVPQIRAVATVMCSPSAIIRVKASLVNGEISAFRLSSVPSRSDMYNVFIVLFMQGPPGLSIP